MRLGQTSYTGNNRIFYVSPYLPEKNEYKKYISPAAQTKVAYMRSLVRERMTTVSINCSFNSGNEFVKTEKYADEYGTVSVLPFFSSTHRILFPVCYFVMLLSVFFFILNNIKKNDIVILYHSVLYDAPVTILKKIINFKIIYEVEEIYADVRNNGNGAIKEVSKIREAADAYIFPTEILNETINNTQLPYLIVYGSYSNSNQQNIKKQIKNKTVIVYSGTLTEGKGVDNVIQCASCLDSDYEIHIIGFGSEKDILHVKQLISNNTSDCKLFFDGLKYGQEYIDYLHNCDVGLCIQTEEQLFNKSSFPSKILSYLRCNLRVVSSRIVAVEKSEIASMITFSDSSNPKDVACAIKKAVKTENKDSNSVLQVLHNKAECRFREILVFLHNEEH